jgi:hypothetical protein
MKIFIGMILTGLNTIRFNDITHTPQVQKRIALAQAAVSQALKLNGLNIPGNQTARKVAEKLPESERSRPCAYFCFGGNASVLIEWLTDFHPGNILIKAGSDCYKTLDSIAVFLPANSLIISDQELSAANLQPVVLTLTNSYRLFSGSFSISGSRGSLPSYRPEPTPFGYSASNVFIYRVSENG